MRHRWSSFILLLAFAASANAQITRTATFDNYAPGTVFLQGSFTDSLSGIGFSYPTNGTYVVDSDSQDLFDGTNYLTVTGGPNDNFGSGFGFTATLPKPSDQVSAFVLSFGPQANVVLSGFDSTGSLVAQASGPSTSTDPFNIEIDSAQYNIVSFQFSVMDRAMAYDNISYTYLPEPTPISSLLLTTIFPLLHRRKIPAPQTPSNQLES